MAKEMIASPLLKYSVFDSKNIDNRTKCGIHRHKYAIRAGFRAVALLSLLVVFCVYSYFQSNDVSDVTALSGRRLSTNDSEIYDTYLQTRSLSIFQDIANPKWLLIVYITLILYLFIAIAIVCDEFFVPALEVMVDPNHLNMSRDVAGATLMAAGGSAPELFTSIIGTFQRSEVGFGTIVGSAVFNVLFVIGMCSLCSTEVLQLSWWPLFRDCTYYVISLIVLAIFVGVVSKGEVELWESLILFGLYIGYVVVMAFNEKLYKMITGLDLNDSDDSRDDGDIGGDYQRVSENELNRTDEANATNTSFRNNITFRAGMLSFLRDKETWKAKARFGLLYGISGNFGDVFDRVDSNGDGNIDRNEALNCFKELGTPVTELELDAIMEDIDEDGDGKVTKSEFKKWYLSSEEYMKNRVKGVFDKFDSDNSGTLNKSEFLSMLNTIDPSTPQAAKDDIAKTLFDSQGRTALSFDHFTEWYFNSMMFIQQQDNINKVEEEGEGVFASLCPPRNASLFGYVKWVLLFPIVASLALTIPDSSRKHLEKWCYASFILSICWIGVYSYFMVGWAGTIGATVGIPDFIMGLTFLAAGTSIPDLLSSIIVARMGEGDMAVSSSIGSNIFDILVGLPFPWILYSLWYNERVTIGADGIWISIMILVGMIIMIITAIHFQGWKLTKTLAYVMFFFYFLFLLQAILRNYL